MGVSRDLAGELLEASVGKAPLTVAAPVYLALLFAPAGPDDDGDALPEVTYPGWRRPAIAGEAWSAAENFEIRNSAPIPLPWPGDVESPVVVGFALLDAETAGRVLFSGEARPFILEPGPPAQVPAGVLRLQLAG